MNRKFKYLMVQIRKTLLRRGLTCPSCGCKQSIDVDRKFIVTSLRRCQGCNLLFRAPTTSVEENEKFYQSDYKEGFTTDMPSAQKLQGLLSAKFSDSEKDYTTYIQVLHALGCKAGDSLFDFGCSWGYGSWQFKQTGFDVTAFEISRPRCAYARQNLGIDAYHSLENIKGQFDIFFSAHVLEHLPSPASVIRRAFSLLKPQGLFVAFTPNGSQMYRKADSLSWHKLWGLTHPNMLDEVYYHQQFRETPYVLASSPYDVNHIGAVDLLSSSTKAILDLSGSELLFAARKQKQQTGWASKPPVTQIAAEESVSGLSSLH